MLSGAPAVRDGEYELYQRRNVTVILKAIILP